MSIYRKLRESFGRMQGSLMQFFRTHNILRTAVSNDVEATAHAQTAFVLTAATSSGAGGVEQRSPNKSPVKFPAPPTNCIVDANNPVFRKGVANRADWLLRKRPIRRQLPPPPVRPQQGESIIAFLDKDVPTTSTAPAITEPTKNTVVITRTAPIFKRMSSPTSSGAHDAGPSVHNDTVLNDRKRIKLKANTSATIVQSPVRNAAAESVVHSTRQAEHVHSGNVQQTTTTGTSTAQQSDGGEKLGMDAAKMLFSQLKLSLTPVQLASVKQAVRDYRAQKAFVVIQPKLQMIYDTGRRDLVYGFRQFLSAADKIVFDDTFETLKR